MVVQVSDGYDARGVTVPVPPRVSVFAGSILVQQVPTPPTSLPLPLSETLSFFLCIPPISSGCHNPELSLLYLIYTHYFPSFLPCLAVSLAYLFFEFYYNLSTLRAWFRTSIFSHPCCLHAHPTFHISIVLLFTPFFASS